MEINHYTKNALSSEVVNTSKYSNVRRKRSVKNEGNSKRERSGFQKGLRLKEKCVTGTAFISIIMNFTNIVLAKTRVGRVFVYISSSLAMFISFFMVINETQLTKLKKFREVLNYLREETNRISRENAKIQSNVDCLEREANRLKDVEKMLETITDTQHSNIDTLLNLVQEHKKISKSLRDVLKKKALEDLTTLIMEVDTNGDFRLEGSEVDTFILSLSCMDEFDVNETRLRYLVEQSGGSLSVIIDVMKSLFKEDGRASKLLSQNGISLRDTKGFLESQRIITHG